MKWLLFVCLCFTGILYGFSKPMDSLRLEMRGGKKLIVHRVVKGETISGIAQRYGMDVPTITSENPMLNQEVKPGQIVRIPVNTDKYGDVSVPPVVAMTDSRLPLAKSLPSQESNTRATSSNAVTPEPKATTQPPVTSVQPEPKPTTQASTEQAYVPEDTTTKRAKVEKKVDKIGTKIDRWANGADPVGEETEPVKPAAPEIKTQKYVVGSNQTVYQLAQTFNTDPELIKSLNHLSSPHLKKGQVILLPAGVQTRSESLVATQPQQQPQQTTATTSPEQNNRHSQASKTAATPVSETSNSSSKSEGQSPKTISDSVPARLPYTLLDSIRLNLDTFQYQIQEVSDQAPVDSFIYEYYGPIDKPGTHIKTNFAKFHNNGISYNITNVRNQPYVRDRWAVAAADSNAIYVDMPIYNKAGSGDKYVTHVVQPGETLKSIAKKYGVTESDLINWNELLKYRVREYQELIVNNPRGSETYYKRSVYNKYNKGTQNAAQTKEESGIALLDPTGKLTGVLFNNVPPGTMIQIQSVDYFKNAWVRVKAGLPNKLPKSAPAGTILILDAATAAILGVTNTTTIIRINYTILD